MPNPTQPRPVKKSEPHKEQALPSDDDKGKEPSEKRNQPGPDPIYGDATEA